MYLHHSRTTEYVNNKHTTEQKSLKPTRVHNSHQLQQLNFHHILKHIT